MVESVLQNGAPVAQQAQVMQKSSLLANAGVSLGANIVGDAASLGLSGLSALVFGGREGFESWRNAFTQQGLTGQQNALQRLEDTQYQRAVKDMQAAGINPAMMFGSSTTAGVTSPSSQPQAATDMDLLSGMNALTAMRQQEAQTEFVKVQTELYRIDTITRYSENIARLRKTLAEGNLTDAERRKTEKELEAYEAAFDDIVGNYSEERRKNAAQADVFEEEAKTEPERRKNIIQDTKLKEADERVKKEVEGLTKEQKAETHERVISLKADNHFIAKMKEAGIPPQILDSNIGIILITALGVDGMKTVVQGTQKAFEEFVKNLSGKPKKYAEKFREAIEAGEEGDTTAADRLLDAFGGTD